MNYKPHSLAADRLLGAILTLQNREECYQFFEDICTMNELFSLSQCYEVASMLRRGRTHLETVEETSAPTVTISRVNYALSVGIGLCNLSLQRLGLIPGKEKYDSGKSDE